jgi:hypothetical protein
MCLLCPGEKLLTNGQMNACHLKAHQEKYHKQTLKENEDYFIQLKFRKLERLQNDAEIPQNSIEPQKLNQASYTVAKNIAKFGIPYQAAEKFFKETLMETTNILYGKEASEICSKIPLSHAVIKRKIDKISSILENELIQNLKNTANFSLQLDESTDVSKNSVLVVFVRYQKLKVLHEELLLCKNLKTTSTGHDVFQLLNNYFQEKELSWSQVSSVSTDGAASMVGRLNGLKAFILSVIRIYLQKLKFLFRTIF